MFTCNGRGHGLYGQEHAHFDARTLHEFVSVPCAGFFCNGAPHLCQQMILAYTYTAGQDTSDTYCTNAKQLWYLVGIALLARVPYASSGT